MIFKTMPRDEVLRALEGHENVLDKAVKEHETYFKYLQCISCGGEVAPIVNPYKLFRSGALLPNYLAKCTICEVEFEPYTGIQTSAPPFDPEPF